MWKTQLQVPPGPLAKINTQDLREDYQHSETMYWRSIKSTAKMLLKGLHHRDFSQVSFGGKVPMVRIGARTTASWGHHVVLRSCLLPCEEFSFFGVLSLEAMSEYLTSVFRRKNCCHKVILGLRKTTVLMRGACTRYIWLISTFRLLFCLHMENSRI